MICCFAWNWLDEDKIHWLGLPSFPGYRKNKLDNTLLIRELHKIVGKADFIVGHNMIEFDDKRCNTEFLIKDLPPTKPHRCICTLKFARHKYGFPINSLKYLCEVLGLPHKESTRGYTMWDECEKGDIKAWAEFEKYNRGDVVSGKACYLKMRPWMVRHPNMSLEKFVCPVCQSKKIVLRGSRTGHRGSFRYSCNDCGKWSTGKIKNDEWRIS